MKVIVNGKAIELGDGATVAELATKLGLPERGSAIAIASNVIPRSAWAEHRLCENDEVVVISAAYGG